MFNSNTDHLKDKIHKNTFTESDLQGLTQGDLIVLIKYYIENVSDMKSTATITLLLNQLRDVNIQVTHDYGTPLHWAVKNKDIFIAELLIKKGAQIGQLDFRFGAPLHYAAQNGDVPMMRCLIVNGADVNQSNDFGQPPLKHAVFNGHIEAARFLLESKARLDVQDQNKHTLLHYAVIEGHIGVVKLLLEKGIRVDAQDVYGKTALQYAYKKKDKAIEQLILQNRNEEQGIVDNISLDVAEHDEIQGNVEKSQPLEPELKISRRKKIGAISCIIVTIASAAIMVPLFLTVKSVKQNLKISIPLAVLSVVSLMGMIFFISSRCDKEPNTLVENIEEQQQIGSMKK